MEIPGYYHHPSDKSKPPELERFKLSGRSYCRFRAGNIATSYPRSHDVLMEDGMVIAEGERISGPLMTDAGLAVLLQDGPFTHIICDRQPIIRIQASLEDIDITGLRVNENKVHYRFKHKDIISIIGHGY
jgi:hypothetical protein